MDREPDQEAGRSTVTRREVLQKGAKLALLWSLPAISTFAPRSAFARSSATCNGPHDVSISATGHACTKADAKHALKKDAKSKAKRACKAIDSCPSGRCAFVSLTLAGVTCKQVPDPNCPNGVGFTCTGTVTTVTCVCPEACGCDVNQPCNVAIDCHGSGGTCNCWVLANRSGCFCGPLVACSSLQPCVNGQCPQGQVCVENCCGQLCYSPCQVGRKASPKGGGPMGIR